MAMTLITTNTESGDATSSFTSGIDSTYKLYIFKFYDLNPATDAVQFTFNGSIDGGSNYNVAKTSTFVRSIHRENDAATALAYMADNDEAQGTGFQDVIEGIGNGGDESGAGTLWLFHPSSTVYVKHFYSDCNSYHNNDLSEQSLMAGYFNTTDNIDAIQFKMSSGDMDGVIKMYGVT